MSEHGRGVRSAHPWLRQLGPPLLLALLADVFIFVLFSWAESRWMPGAGERTLFSLHLLRGVMASGAVALIMGLALVRNIRPFQRSSEETPNWPEPGELPAESRSHNFARWFVAIRWLALATGATLVVAAGFFSDVLSRSALEPLLVTLGALALANLGYTAVLRRPGHHSWLLPVQVCVDAVFLVVILHFSGGVESPLTVVMLLEVLVAGVVLTKSECYASAAVATALLCLMALGESSGYLAYHPLRFFAGLPTADAARAVYQPMYVATHTGLIAIFLFFTAYVSTSVSSRLHEDARRFTSMADWARNERQVLVQALDMTETGLRVLDADLKCRWKNDTWRKWFNDENLETPLSIHPCRACFATKQDCRVHSGINCSAVATWSDGRVRVREVPGPSEEAADAADGDPTGGRTFQLVTAALKDTSGAVVQVVEFVRDITREKRENAQLMRAGKLAAVGELAGNVAHEVNNPLAIIGGKARLLLGDHRDEMSPKVSEELEKIVDLSDRAAKIAQGLLAYCRPSTGHRTKVDLRQPIERAIGMIEQHAKSENINIERQLPGEPLWAKANAEEIEQVVLNLLLNAMDAMPDGGSLGIVASPPISAADPAMVDVAVSDTGAGIEPHVRKRIFEPFFSTKPKGKGTGLGLSICHGLVRSHGGEIDVSSEVGSGTTFVVRLPSASRAVNASVK